MRHLKEFALILIIALAWFAGVFFAVAALSPGLAYPVALLVTVGAMGAYIFLSITGSDREGLPVGLLLLFPFVCLVAGILWWILRLVGLWRIN